MANAKMEHVIASQVLQVATVKKSHAITNVMDKAGVKTEIVFAILDLMASGVKNQNLSTESKLMELLNAIKVIQVKTANF